MHTVCPAGTKTPIPAMHQPSTVVYGDLPSPHIKDLWVPGFAHMFQHTDVVTHKQLGIRDSEVRA